MQTSIKVFFLLNDLISLLKVHHCMIKGLYYEKEQAYICCILQFI